MAVICYIPTGDVKARQFIAMLYASWKYVNEHAHQVERTRNFHNIDLLAFCHPSVCPLLYTVCKEFKSGSNIKDTEMNCWAIEQTFQAQISYIFINSFVMFERADIHDIVKPYKNLLRSDFDVFITPVLLTLQPAMEMVFGLGAYCHPFNENRLKQVAFRLGMRHQNVHCVGSTWYGEKNLFIKVGKKSYEMTRHVWLNEFNPSAYGLESIDFRNNPEGEWKRWYSPVSSMYGAELAINHLVNNLSEDNKRKFDSSSCSDENYLTTPHIHCWHARCEFQKFVFMEQLDIAIQSKGNFPVGISIKIVENTEPRTYGSMTISEYCTFIAWNSVGKYILKNGP